jgi:ATP-binding cassette subfamily C protein/ATP-binding cassette subfamily C protein EexD
LHFTDAAGFRIGLLTITAVSLRRIIQILLMAVGTYLVIDNALTPGGMMAASILMGQGLRPVEGAIGAWRNLVTARGAFLRLKGSLAAGAAARVQPMSLPPPRGHVEVERVVYTPEGQAKPILKGVSLQVQPGQVVGIIGPSGAGKTTLARIIVGALRPRAGAVRLDGAEVHSWNQTELGRHIGYLPQDVQLLAGTVRDNIARMESDAPAEKIIEAARKAGLHDLILQLPKAYDTDIGEAGGFLSGGQRQRLALARALYGNPQLLVLDEPNSNLDPDGEQALNQAIASAKAAGTTVIVITHRPSLVAQASTIVVMNDGVVQMLGPSEQVMPKVSRPAARAATSASVHYLDGAAVAASPAPAE